MIGPTPDGESERRAMAVNSNTTMPSTRRNDSADSRLAAVTGTFLASVTGSRTSRRMEEEARGVLNNLKGHRDRGEPLTEAAASYVRRASEAAVTPAQIVRDTQGNVGEFARLYPQRFAETVSQAARDGFLSPQEVNVLFSLSNHPDMIAAYDRWLRERAILEQAERNNEELRRWADNQEAIWPVAGGPQTPPQPSSETLATPPEPEPEPVAESAFNLLASPAAKPRRLFKKLKSLRQEKEANG